MSIATLAHIKKKVISFQKKEEAVLQIKFNDVYDISCSDVSQIRQFKICSTIDDSKQILQGEALNQHVSNETKFYTLKYKVISEAVNNPSSKTKFYEFEINVKQLFEYCQNEQTSQYLKRDQIAFYEQKANPQGFIDITVYFYVQGKYDKNNKQK